MYILPDVLIFDILLILGAKIPCDNSYWIGHPRLSPLETNIMAPVVIVSILVQMLPEVAILLVQCWGSSSTRHTR